MPQLEQINTFSAQIFWLFVCLGIIYLFLSRFVVPKLGGVIQLRENTISGNVNQAESLKDQAVSIKSEFEKQSASSRADAMNIVSNAANHANSLYDKGILDTEAELKKQVDSSEKDINSAKDAASAELNKNIVNFVEEIVAKVSEIKGDKKAIEKIVSKINS